MDPSVAKDLIILHSHARLTEGLVGRGVDLVVWPESSVGIDPARNDDVRSEVEDAGRAIGVPMVVGGNESVDDTHYRVMAYEVQPDRGIVDSYQKTHLVPFGEYVPGRKLLSWIPMLDQIPDDAVAGTERTLFDLGDGRVVAPVLSFEGDFGTLVRRRIADGGRLLVVATNTSTWGHTWASAQHAAFSQVRAAENGVWVVHAAHSGISEFIAPDGTVAGRAPLYEATTLLRDLRFANHETLYTRMGDWFPVACGMGALLWLLFAGRRKGPDGSVT
jgi:apolipoprotein N-acyltransferase